METTLKGTVRYDGTGFAGWQRQDNNRTVQGALEDTLSRIAGEPIAVQGASRTDAGVHALGQVFSCRWPGTPPDRLRHAVSSMLRPEIQVTALESVRTGFNARFDAWGKQYAYALDFGREPDPLAARYAWHVPYRAGLDVLRGLLPKLEGRHDFAGFESTGSQSRTTERTLHAIRLCRGPVAGPADNPNLWRFELEGDAFLYHMVRNIVGTLIEIGRDRFEPAFLQESLDRAGPFRGHCAPAHGLFLVRVDYAE